MTANLRRLVYVPVLHAREDSRLTASVLRGSEQSRLKAGEINVKRSAVDEMWAGIAAKITELALPWNKTRIYQDGLPVCGEESKIAARLAENGSWNHVLILNLLKKGAKLEGTENMDFLMREYDLLNVLLMKQSDANPETKAEAAAAKEEYQAKSRELLKLRDEFILNRVKSTLQNDEVAVIFMGVMHRLDKMLENDFLISYIIYRLPFRSVGAIYNA